MKKLYALGVGHNTPVFIDLALACGYEIAGLYHYKNDRTNQYDHGFKIIGSFEDLFAMSSLENKSFLLTMGDIKIREELSKRIIDKGGEIPSLIHPLAVISRFAKVSPIGVYISPFTYVQADVSIGRNTILLSHVNISHTTHIGNNCFLAGGAIIGAYTHMEDYVFVGQGALTITAKVKRIGTMSYIAARALITHDVEDKAIMVGIPAKMIGEHKL